MSADAWGLVIALAAFALLVIWYSESEDEVERMRRECELLRDDDDLV